MWCTFHWRTYFWVKKKPSFMEMHKAVHPKWLNVLRWNFLWLIQRVTSIKTAYWCTKSHTVTGPFHTLRLIWRGIWIKVSILILRALIPLVVYPQSKFHGVRTKWASVANFQKWAKAKDILWTTDGKGKIADVLINWSSLLPHAYCKVLFH